MTGDMLQVTGHMWKVIHANDSWPVTHGVGWKPCHNFISLALKIWELSSFEELEEKDDLTN